jgi:hypothetical protein
MFCCLFHHLITNDVELVLGCVNVFGGLQSLCSFVLVNCKGILDCFVPLAENLEVNPMERLQFQFAFKNHAQM